MAAHQVGGQHYGGGFRQTEGLQRQTNGPKSQNLWLSLEVPKSLKDAVKAFVSQAVRGRGRAVKGGPTGEKRTDPEELAQVVDDLFGRAFLTAKSLNGRRRAEDLVSATAAFAGEC